MKSVVGLNELHSDPELISRLPHAPLENRLDVQRLGDRADIRILPLE